MRVSRFKSILGVAVVLAIMVTLAALAIRSRTESAEQDKILASVRSAGLPITESELDAILGPMPSVQDQRVVKDMTDAEVRAGIQEHEGRLVDPVWFKERAEKVNRFLESASPVARLKEYRFTETRGKWPGDAEPEIRDLSFAINLFCARALDSARSGQPDKAVQDLSKVRDLVNLATKSAGPAAMRASLTGRQYWYQWSVRCLASGDWPDSSLESMSSMIQNSFESIDPLKTMASDFLVRWQQIADSQKQPLDLFVSDEDDLSKLAVPENRIKIRAELTRRAIAAQSLFSDTSLDMSERLIRADAMEAAPSNLNLTPVTFDFLISARSNTWAKDILLDHLRASALRTFLDILIRKSKGVKDWDRADPVSLSVDSPIYIVRKDDRFSVSIKSTSLNSRLALTESMVPVVEFKWPEP